MNVRNLIFLLFLCLPFSFSAADTASSGLFDSLGFGDDANEFLEPDKAFVFSSEVVNGNTIIARWDIADGYYLYRERFKFSIENSDVTLGTIVFPKGKIKHDESFGEMEVYFHDVEATISLHRKNLSPEKITFTVNYQGCKDGSICYAPMSKTIELSLPATTQTSAMTDEPVVMSEQDSIARALSDDNLFIVLLTFFGFGLLLSFTPCVFPMIPILSSIIVGQGDSLSTHRAFVLSLTYVLAMALTYTSAGIIAGWSGHNLQAAFQEPWLLISFSSVFVLLALSMFGFYDLQLPSALQSKLNELSNRQQGGSIFGVAIMGFLSALIVGPCVAPPLAGALIYISQTRDAMLGGLALFAMSMGMGTPLIAIGTSAGKWLPKAGAWMNIVKAVFGVMLLGLAIWMLERILSPDISMALWAILFIVTSVFMGTLQSMTATATSLQKLGKGLGIILLIYGVMLLIGSATGARDMFHPLERISFSETGQQKQFGVKFKHIKGLDEFKNELNNAKGKPVMIDFYADWCVDCVKLERTTFTNPEIVNYLQRAVVLQSDVTSNDDLDKALMKHFGIIGPPAILFFDAEGNELKQYRLVGYSSPDKFLNHIRNALK
ncbi:MAG: protein-disulfide reductase DsbD [Gammaproteobacteria bacterium]|nr:protein-disulfide reductase DsbD [Gammaproteobacteria bacterium]